MKSQVPITLPWSMQSKSLAADVRWELRNQLTSLATLALWAIIPVIVLTISGLWMEMAHELLLAWGGLALLHSVLGFINNRINIQHLKNNSSTDQFNLRNSLYYLLVGIAWGLLPVLAAFWGSERALWFALIITMAIMTALVLVLSTSHRIFFAALTPAGLLVLLSILSGPIYSMQLLLLGLIYLVALVMMHNTLFQIHVDRVRTSLHNAAHASALANTLEHHDALTGIYNKAGLNQWLQILRGNEATYQSVCVALANVKGYSEINALYGTSVADTLLVEIAKRLNQKAGDRIGLARLSGAEFLLVDARTEADAEALALLLASLEHEDFIISNRLINISIQLSSVQGNIDDMDSLVETARSRLLSQRSESTLSASSDTDKLQFRRDLVMSFHDALLNNQIKPCFQPIVHCKTNAIIGFEALVRWQHPTLGEIMPEDFLDLVKISGRATELTRNIFDSSAQFASALMQANYIQAANISINFTASDLASSTTMEWILQILQQYQLKPAQMTIEISEKEALIQDTQFGSNLQRMEQAGLPLAIDDFGTGYANISHLLDLPASTVKLDKRFVDKLPFDKHSVALVRAIITMASSMGMRTIAEGVERTDQLEFLRNNGCDAYQGYLAGLAQPPENALHLVSIWRSLPQ